MEIAENKLRFKDPRKKKEIILFYRDPTVDDWIAYWAERATGYSEGEEPKSRLERHFRIQFDFGKRILTGFETSDGILKDISMDDPEWKEKLGQKIPQFIMTLGSKVFAEEDLDAEKNF